MLIKKLLFVGAISSLVVGCADLSGKQPPAPVYGRQLGGSPRAEVHSEPKASDQEGLQTSPTVKIQPIKDITTPEVMPIESTPVETDRVPSVETPVAAPTDVMPLEKTENVVAIESNDFQPLDSVASGSAAVSALVLASNQDSKSGKMDSAVSTMERAIRLEPRNPTLLYKLAVLRLQQSKPAQAEDLAKKAALLASKDARLKKHSWLLIARAREMQQDTAGAAEARQKADSF